jgi:hypothetical protein
MALRTSGRFNVMIATRSRIVHSSSSVPVSMMVSLVVMAEFPPVCLRRHCEEPSDKISTVIPGCAAWRRPGIHNHACRF